MPRKTAGSPETDPVSHFERAMQELERIVSQMEGDELPLQQSLKLFERGVGLARECRQSLTTAELRVKNLLDTVEGADRDAETDRIDPRPGDSDHE